jgi:hypothetical protein
METFLTISAATLALITLVLCNTLICSSLEEILGIEIPKWLLRLVLIPPLAFVLLLLICVIHVITYIVISIKEIW